MASGLRYTTNMIKQRTTPSFDSLLSQELGATAVEYAILLALIVALLMATVIEAGGASGLIFGRNADAISVINQ